MTSPANIPRHSRRAGSTLIESALVFALFIQMVLAVVEAARVMYFYNWVAYAAREGTRYASVSGSSSNHVSTAASIQTFVLNQAVTYDSTNVTVTTTWIPNNSSGSSVKVTVAYAYHPFIGLIFPAALTLTSSSEMVISQ